MRSLERAAIALPPELEAALAAQGAVIAQPQAVGLPAGPTHDREIVTAYSIAVLSSEEACPDIGLIDADGQPVKLLTFTFLKPDGGGRRLCFVLSPNIARWLETTFSPTEDEA